MPVRLITGPPGAGKNTYIEKHKKDGDFVVDFDLIRDAYPTLDLEQLKVIRNSMEDVAKTYPGDAWVIRCVADAEKRQTLAQSLGAIETVVLETPADVAKERVKERNRNPERNDEVFGAIDEWWSQYGVVSSDVIVKPDMGTSIRQDENQMAKPNNEYGYPDETPVAEMTYEQQAAYWKRQSRKHEGAKKDLEKELEELKDPKNAPLSREDLEKEIRADIAKENLPNEVRAKFKSILADRLSDEDFDEVIDGLDHTKFLTAEGAVDAEKVEKRANIIAPPAVKRVVRRQAPAVHQGPRERQSSSTIQSGRDLFAEFSGQKTS